jgi:hypothetical protein
MKLYVWEKVFTDYTDGLAFAIAHDKEEAIREILGNRPFNFAIEELRNKEPEIHELDKPYGNYVYGGG